MGCCFSLTHAWLSYRMIWDDVIICMCAYNAGWTWIYSCLLNCLSIYLHYSFLSPSSFISIMNLGLWSVWGPKLLPPAASPTGGSHGAPNTSLEYWINPTTTSVLPNQHRHYFLAITLNGGGPGLWEDGWALNLLCSEWRYRKKRHRQVEHLRLFDTSPFPLQNLPSRF